MNWVDKKYDMYVDNVRLVKGDGFWNSATSAFTKIYLYTRIFASHYDDILIRLRSH